MRQCLLFIALLFTSVNLNVHAMNVVSEQQYQESELRFYKASIDQKEFLVAFAIASNAIYKTLAVSRKVVESVFAIDDQIFLNSDIEILKCDDEIVGFFTINLAAANSEVCELNHLFVKAGLQRRGLGSRLLTRAMELAREKRCSVMTFISDPDAKEFYLKKGGRITGYDENLLNPSVDVPLFELSLH
jgi:GNAT superfamily N-acetyltransferase